ncbi:hypothetical protein CDAR_17521 [Caerostris darwini]|uniref:Uncharacterized protein n=1 Tax=Caerostris darwini TaxID=1538125 RepID=A0AAV4NBA5_9ARAC|nr:hypothetical protein CDAR_17521 [Caerostris darwini]
MRKAPPALVIQRIHAAEASDSFRRERFSRRKSSTSINGQGVNGKERFGSAIQIIGLDIDILSRQNAGCVRFISPPTESGREMDNQNNRI